MKFRNNQELIVGKPSETDWIAGKISGITYEEVQSDGQWGEFLPTEERQRVLFDTLACVTFSGLNSIETELNRKIVKNEISKVNYNWLKYKGYLDDNGLVNFSDRFTAKMSNTTKSGNYLAAVGDSMRNSGLVPESLYKNGDATDWNSYYTDISDELKKLGEEFLERFEIQYEWVLCGKESTDVLKRHLRQAPLQLAVTCCDGWSKSDIVQGCGVVTEHAIELYGYDDSCFNIFDTYSPFKKRLASDYGIAYAMKYVIIEKEEKLKEEKTKNILLKILYTVLKRLNKKV